ncbi:helix-turn-helix domain-containing protein [Paenibacillus sp. D2_2]|nr:helix-turn-helix domain-containing protein [Paenibacillus sp. D2_2]WMT43624.1 helix-turn-helix domain-containing protein [Paenibacillus sp. D2_2]
MECETLMRNDDIALVLRSTTVTEGRTLLKQAASQIRQTLKCELFAAIGTEVSQFSDLHESYHQALYASTFRGLVDVNNIITYEQVKDRNGGRTVCSLEEEAELASLLQNGGSIELKAWVTDTIGKQLKDPELTPESLRAFLISIVVSGHRWLERVIRAIGKGDLPALVSAKDLPESFSLVTEPAESLFQHLIAIRDAYHKSAADGPSSYIQQSVAYIQEHLDSNITLQQVAGAVHLHPHHFSEVFKREMGINYIEFVTRERMRRAEELLTQSPAKISEIAKSVGYEDIKYFGQLFKKHSGKTPSEFRGKV